MRVGIVCTPMKWRGVKLHESAYMKLTDQQICLGNPRCVIYLTHKRL
jgi:hypothetical protein